MAEATNIPTTGFLVMLIAPSTCGSASSRVPTAKKAISPILRKHVKVNSTIISDDFASYVSVNGKHTRLLRGMDYTHRWVNHDECLVDPVTGAHTNRIKGAWVVRIKPHLKRMRGVRKELLAGYLDESLCETWFFAGKVHVCTYLEGLAMVIRKHYQA
ncbi:hypothetical protein PF005_g9478 [Phytophthora fragariae]|uniref:ISXO2-like transposase domain-containing protein n=1 Tax=Phytophthora fragariae TaxID=53985 RepID=A0A6A3L335_9STRA|nr:hypothetical protein PF011_g8244 [Phytophthora fragariae]KAE9116686.1 hypothetical protein PF010_g8875 [Phytophthora fragariae]KAE9215344.1 hypothetical protein PF005_g9478 [Phytophthora fragariae]KAE9237582.1 hypothetical protein PF004_g8533 [Phytophthora fragariae]KAE9238480.1 hypothetical protein PF002_g10649 [Phytophthora fragariae]